MKDEINDRQRKLTRFFFEKVLFFAHKSIQKYDYFRIRNHNIFLFLREKSLQ